MTGIIPGGVAADGMTKEQVKMAAGDPTQHEQINGGEVWIYVREKFVNIDPHNDPSAAYGSGPNNQRNFTETANLGPRPSVIEKVSVFFDGERVTHVQITRE